MHLLILFLVPAVLGKENVPCHNPVPGLDDLARGVDVTKLDLFPDVAREENQELRAEVIELNCAERKKWTNPDVVTFEVPDEIIDWDPLSPELQIADPIIMQRRTNLKSSMAHDAGVHLDFHAGAFSAAPRFRETHMRMETNNTVFGENRAYVNVATATLDSIKDRSWDKKSKIKLSQAFRKELDGLPETLDDFTYPAFRKLFETFGTHYFEEVTLGGSLSSRFTIDHSVSQVLDTKTLVTQVKSAFLRTLKAQGAYYGKIVDAADERFTRGVLQVNKYFGGQEDPFVAGGYKKWASTVSHQPLINSGKLKKITNLLNDKEPQKKNLEQALVAYMDHSYLKELMDVVNSYLDNEAFRSDGALHRIMLQLQLTQASPIPNGAELVRLAHDVDDSINPVPEWFKALQFCFKYYGYNEVCFPINASPAKEEGAGGSDRCPCADGFGCSHSVDFYLKGLTAEQKKEVTDAGLSFDIKTSSSKDEVYFNVNYLVHGTEGHHAPAWLQRTHLCYRRDHYDDALIKCAAANEPLPGGFVGQGWYWGQSFCSTSLTWFMRT